LRVIAGSAKGRKLVTVPGTGTRPITAKVKAALFNILGPDIRGSTFLDLFAGTGSVGIEALSRGAEHVVFVELSRKAVRIVRRNLESTGFAERADVVQGDAFRFIGQAPADLRFDYIYVAPPQYRALWSKALLALDAKPLLTPGGLVIVQIFPKEFEPVSTSSLEMIRERRYGSTLLQFYGEREGGEEQSQEVGA